MDASAGGTLVNMTTYVREIDAWAKEFDALDDTHLDDSAERVIPGIEKSTEFAIRGAFEDTATSGPDAIFSTAVGTILSFEYNPIGTASGRRKISAEVFVMSYSVGASVKGQVEYEARFKKDGSTTIGTN